MASLGQLVIELAANSARLQSDLGKAVNIAQGAARKFQSIFGGVAALAGAGSLGAVVTRSIEMGDALNKAASRAGIGGQAMSELAYAARTVDVDLGSLSKALQTMQVNLSKAAAGSKEQNKQLADMGVAITDLQGLKADKQFEILADRISRLANDEDRARAITERFGEAGGALGPLFEKGAAGIRKAREEAQRIGASLTQEQINKLSKADDSIKRLRESWEGFGRTLAVSVGPLLSATLDRLSGESFFDSLFGNKTGTQDQQLQYLETRLAFLKEAAASGAKNADLIADTEERIARITQKRGASGGGRRGRYTPSDSPVASAVAAEDTLTEVVVTASKVRAGAMQRYYDSLEGMTKTNTERQLSDFIRIEGALNELYANGLITAEQYNARWQEYFDDLIPEVKVTAQKLGQVVQEESKRWSDDIQWYIDDMQGSFTRFLSSSHDGIKGLGRDLIDTLKYSIAEGLSGMLFKSRDKGGFGLGDAFGSLFSFGKSLFGFANGGSFQVGGSGGTDSQLVAFKASPNERVTVTKPGQGMGAPSVVINQHIDARGATRELAAVLPAILKAHGEETELRIVQRLRRNYYG